MGFGEQWRLLPRVKQSFPETALSSLSWELVPLLDDPPMFPGQNRVDTNFRWSIWPDVVIWIKTPSVNSSD
jgi:hypothetical protein